jgi:hypothetical protein
VGGLVRAQAERRCAAVVPGEDALDVVVDIVWSEEHERPLTLCERMCLEARARMSSIFFSRPDNTDLPVETRARFPKKFQHPIENAF